MHLARLGDHTPSWTVGRWVVQQAYRWMLLNADPRVDDAVRLTLVATHDFPLEIGREELYELGNRVAGCDWICEEIALYASHGLADFLDVKAGPELLSRAGPVERWPHIPLASYRYGALEADTLTVRDWRSGANQCVLHLGCVTGAEPDAPVLGRIVPIPEAPGQMFERRPLEVDEATAKAVARASTEDPLAWLWELSTAIEEGRMPHRPGVGTRTPVWSDVVPEGPSELDDSEPAGRVQDLMTAGVPRAVAEAVGTCELALVVAKVAPDALPVAACHAALALTHPAVLDAVRRYACGSETAEGWRAIAACVAEPTRAACRALAEQAAGA
jgi:hypothetical protein